MDERYIAQFCTASDTAFTPLPTPRLTLAGPTGYRGKLKEVRKLLAALLNCSPDDLVLVDNASNAINVLLARLGLIDDPFEPAPTYAPVGPLKKPAVLLDLSTAYGPFEGYYEWLRGSRGVEIVTANLTFPCTSADIVEAVRSTLAARAAAGAAAPTVAVISQITSVPALHFPVKELTALLHAHGAKVIVDGAHALGNVACDLGAGGALADADAWFGNAHKWLWAPKSAAVLYVKKAHHGGDLAPAVFPQPTVVDSWGDSYVDRFEWDGTRDRSPMCAIKDALAFRQSLGGEAAIMEYTHSLAKWAGEHLSGVWKTRVLNGAEADERNSMVNVEVPVSAEQCGKLVKALHDDEGLYVIGSTAASGPYPSVPGFKCFFRLSAQVYLERSDFVRLGEAVLKRVRAE